jgi:hypothetical protein
MMMMILRQRLAAVVPGGSPTSRLLKRKGKTRKEEEEEEEVKVIVTSTAVFSPPDSSQQPHSHAQTNVHQCNNALQKHSTKTPRQPKLATLSSLTEKTGNNRRETQRERGGGEFMSTVRYEIGRWDGRRKKTRRK